MPPAIERCIGSCVEEPGVEQDGGGPHPTAYARTHERHPMRMPHMHRTGPYPLSRDGRSVHGSCCTRMLFGVVLPTFTRIGSRSLPLPVYFTWPFRFTSRVL